MLKFAIAGAVLALGLAAGSATVFANDCVDCAPPSRYDSEDVINKIRSMERSRGGETRHATAARRSDCADCPPPRKYDSQEVVKKTRNIDRSRVINTTTVVPVGSRVKETNSLVIRENETRNIGVIQHNHTIIEKETRYVRRIPLETRVVFVTQHYRVVEQPETVAIPVATRRQCGRGRSYGRYGSCGPLRVRG
jgi:hypothetical protein